MNITRVNGGPLKVDTTEYVIKDAPVLLVTGKTKQPINPDHTAIPEVRVIDDGEVVFSISLAKITAINGTPFSGTLSDAILAIGGLLMDQVTGPVEPDTLVISKQPQSQSIAGRASFVLFVDFIGDGATIAWRGSTDSGATFPYGPYSAEKYWLYNGANGPGFYRADITYKGQVYHSATIEITN